MRYWCGLILGFLLWGQLAASAQKLPGKPLSSSDTLEYYYEGTLEVNKSTTLRLAFLFKVHNDSVLSVVADSRDQFSFDIPVTRYYLAEDSLYCKIASAAASFSGKVVGDHFEGVFKQRGMKRNITLFNKNERLLLTDLRPQIPQPPFSYTEKELEIEDESGKAAPIVGTLTTPQNPKALLLLVSGSGWQNRDEYIMGHSPFWVLSDFLSDAGYAVFRYDDRPAQLFATSTTFDFVEDVERIIRHFKQDDSLKNLPVGIVGHSEGGLIAFMVAAQKKKVDFIISLAGCSEHISQVLLYQAGAILKLDTTVAEEMRSASMSLNAKIYKALETSKSEKAFSEFYQDEVKNYNEAVVKAGREEYQLSQSDMIAQLASLNSPWFRKLFTIYPEKYIRKIKVPVLALNGTKDLQVYYKTNLALIQKYIPENQYHKFIPLENLNHLFQEAETGSPTEYGNIQQTFSPKAMEEMRSWLDNLIANTTKNIK